jgi:predicted nucleic acid-binding protein
MIKNAALALVACASLCLAACATGGGLDTVNSGKALAVGWSSLDAAAITVDAAVQAGKLRGPAAKTVHDDLVKARDALTAADAAYHGAASTTNPGAQIAIASAAVAEITLIVSGAK